jgi:hypothetical protein
MEIKIDNGFSEGKLITIVQGTKFSFEDCRECLALCVDGASIPITNEGVNDLINALVFMLQRMKKKKGDVYLHSEDADEGCLCEECGQLV